MKYIESTIRDKLIDQLDIFGEELTFLKKEKFLPNDKGTRGFVDLLASDSMNRFVIIELKRSRGASREAIHEVLKYIEGIKENKSLKNNEIIAYIVSTEWDELLVPFSSFVKDVSYSVRGYKLVVDIDLNPIYVTRVEPLNIKNERILSNLHSIALYTEEQNLKKGIESYINSFSKKKITDYVLLILKANKNLYSYTGFSKNEISEWKKIFKEYKYLIYSSVQTMTDEEYWSIIKTDKSLYEEVNEYVNDWSDKDISINLHLYAVEDCEPRPFFDYYEISYPAKLATKLLKEEKWEIQNIIRSGGLKNNNLLTDETILQELTGSDGLDRIRYFKKFNSKNSSILKKIKEEVSICLEFNPYWLSGVIKAIE